MAASGACSDPAGTWERPRRERTNTSQIGQTLRPAAPALASAAAAAGVAGAAGGLAASLATSSTEPAGASGLPWGLMLHIPSAWLTVLLAASPHMRRLRHGPRPR